MKKIHCAAVISLSFFVWGGFLYVRGAEAQGVPRPDLVTAPKFVGNQLRYNLSNNAPGPLNGTFEVQVRWLSSTNVQIGSPSIRSVSTPLPISSMLTHTPPSFIISPPAGADHVEVTVDSGTDIIETNDGNNVGYVSLPELSIDSVTAASDGIRFVLRNSGPGPVTGLSSVVGITASYRMEWLREDETVISTGTGSYTFSMSPNNVHTILNNSPFATTERPSDARKLRVTFDTPDAILERDSTNNSRTADVALPSMDLALDAPLSFNATSATYTVKNNTSTPVSGTYTLRAGWAAAEGTTLLSPITTPVSLSIPADGTVTLTHTNAAFYGVPDGRATKLRLSINPSDIAGFTDETDFSNNSREADRTTFPDFSLENLTNVSWGVGFDIRNSGPVTFSGSVPIKFYWLSETGTTVGTPSSTGFSATIPSGGTFHTTRVDGFMADVPVGAVRVRLIVNDPSLVASFRVPESDTTNNTADIARSGIPDLRIESAFVNSTSTTYTISNVGNADFNARLGYRYTWVRPGNYTVTTTGLLLTAETLLIPAGGTLVRTDNNALIEDRPGSDTHLRIEVNPDGLGHVVESNDDNNMINAAPTPDLTVESLSITATSTSVTFRNVGGGVYDGLFRYHFYWNGPEDWVNPFYTPDNYGTPSTISQWVPVAYVDAITVGQTITFAHGEEFVRNPPDGATRFGVEINAPGVGRYPEITYANNILFVDATSVPRADFVFDSATLSGSDATVTIRNAGPIPYLGLLNLNFEWLRGDGSSISASVRGLSEDTQLDPNETLTRTIGGDAFFGVPPAGAESMRITLNPPSAVRAPEANYTNNIINVPRPIADLIIESAAYDSAMGRTRYVIKNIGTLTSFRETQVRFDWFESDSSPGGTSYDGGVWNLPPSESLERTYVHAAGSATRVRITVDNNGAVAESNNSNNSLEISLMAEDTTGEELAEEEEEEALEDIAVEAGGGSPEQEEGADNGEQETGDGTGSSDDSSSGSDSSFSGTRQISGTSKGETTVPKVLPGSFAYLFKNMGRGIRSAMTFNTEAKAELRLQIAAEKLLEANALSEKGEGDRAAEHLASYASDIAKVSGLAAKLSAKDESAGNALATRAVGSALRHQTIIGKIERGAGVEGRSVAEEARTLALEHTAKTIALVKSEEETQKIVSNALKRDGSPFRSLRNLEIIDAVGPKLSGAAAEAVEREKEINQNAFASQLRILPTAREQLLAGYIKNSGGQEDSYVKSLEVASAKGAPRTAAFIEAESEARVHLQTRVEALVAATPERAAKALERLSDGSVAGLRALHAVVDTIDSKGKTHAEEALKGAIEKIKTHDKQTLSKELSEVRDIKGLRIIEDIKAASPEKKTELDAVEKVLVRDIANTVTKAGSQKSDRNDKAVNAIVDASPEAARIIERAFKDDTKTKDILLKTRLEKVELAAEIDKKEKPLKTEKKSDTSQVKPVVKEGTPRSTEPSKEKVMPLPKDVKESVAPSFQKVDETTKVTKPIVAPKTETTVPTPPKTVTEPSTKTVLPAVEQVAVPAKESSPQLPTPVRETVVVPTTEAVVAPTSPKTTEPAVVCTKEVAYVCGANGITYLNNCFAKQAGVSVSYIGECKLTTAPTSVVPKTDTTVSVPPTTTETTVKTADTTTKTSETTAVPTTTSEPVKTAPESVTTTKVSPPSATFQTSAGATSAVVSSGTAVTLVWKTSGATSVSLDQGIGTVEASGSRAIKVLKTTTYTLTAKNSAGAETRSLTVTVK